MNDAERQAQDEPREGQEPALGGSDEQPSPAAPAAKPRRDRGPKRRGKRKPATQAPAGEQKRKPVGVAAAALDKKLERELARVLVFPAVPSIMVAPSMESKAYLASHFTSVGPATAAQLVEASKSSPELRDILERLTKGSVTLTIAVALIAYISPPVLWIAGARAQAQGVTAALQLATSMDESMLEDLMSQVAANADVPPTVAAPEPDPAAAGAEAAAGAPAL